MPDIMCLEKYSNVQGIAKQVLSDLYRHSYASFLLDGYSETKFVREIYGLEYNVVRHLS